MRDVETIQKELEELLLLIYLWGNDQDMADYKKLKEELRLVLDSEAK